MKKNKAIAVVLSSIFLAAAMAIGSFIRKL